MLLALNLEIQEAAPPSPAEAAGTLYEILSRHPVAGHVITPAPNAASPDPSRPWEIGEMLPVAHPQLPDTPFAATWDYLPAGKSSRGGYTFSVNVPPESGIEPAPIAELLASLGEAWLGARGQPSSWPSTASRMAPGRRISRHRRASLAQWAGSRGSRTTMGARPTSAKYQASRGPSESLPDGGSRSRRSSAPSLIPSSSSPLGA